VPKTSINVGDSWQFSGYEFKVLAENSSAEKYLYFIEALPTASLIKELGRDELSFPLKNIVFLYSKSNGLLSFTKHFKTVNERWVLLQND